jgi:hypothetical protein
MVSHVYNVYLVGSFAYWAHFTIWKRTLVWLNYQYLFSTAKDKQYGWGTITCKTASPNARVSKRDKDEKDVTCSQWHILRDRRPSTTGDGDKGTGIVYVEEKIFSTGPTRAAKTEQKLLSWHNKPICTLWVPIHLSLNSQQGSPLCSVSTCSTLVYNAECRYN